MDLQALSYYRRFRLDRFIAEDYLDVFRVHHFRAGEKICESDGPIEWLRFFVEGRVQVFLPTENGRRLLLCFYDPPQLFGDLELFQDGLSAVTTIEALTPCVCLSLPHSFVVSRLAKESAFLEELCRSLGRKLGRVIRNSALNLLHPLEYRVASYILAVTPPGRRPVFTGNLSRIAELLGTSFRHLHRTLGILCEKGILLKEGRGYVLLEIGELEKRAVGVYVIE